MIQESELAKAASRLVRAETNYRAIKSYYDNMPADPDFDLGLSLSWNWGRLHEWVQGDAVFVW